MRNRRVTIMILSSLPDTSPEFHPGIHLRVHLTLQPGLHLTRYPAYPTPYPLSL